MSGHIPGCVYFINRVGDSVFLVGPKVEKYLKNLFGLSVQPWSKMAPSKETRLLLPGVNATKPVKVYPIRKQNNPEQD